jgi:methylamine dehydrogenase accessory protein MauD
MSQLLIISNIALWGLCIGLIGVMLALVRQIGVLYERIEPMGALMMDDGPKAGEVAPVMTLNSIGGQSITIGKTSHSNNEKATLLFFVSPTCPVCKKLLPIIKSVAMSERSWLNIVLASDGDDVEHLSFVSKQGLQAFPYINSRELGMKFRVSKLPYAVLIGEDGRVQAKGLINSREQLESLFTAREMGVVSIQDYLSAA